MMFMISIALFEKSSSQTFVSIVKVMTMEWFSIAETCMKRPNLWVRSVQPGYETS